MIIIIFEYNLITGDSLKNSCAHSDLYLQKHDKTLSCSDVSKCKAKGLCKVEAGVRSKLNLLYMLNTVQARFALLIY